MNKTDFDLANQTVIDFVNNPKSVTVVMCKAVCDTIGITYTAKITKSELIDLIKSAVNEYTRELEANKPAPAVVDTPKYSKRDVESANYPELLKIADALGIEESNEKKYLELKRAILESGKLTTTKRNTNGDGVRARNARNCEKFISNFITTVKALGFTEYTKDNKDGITDGYTITHNGARISFKIDGLSRFTFFVQSAHLNVAVREKDADALGYVKETPESKPEDKTFSNLSYTFPCFIKSIEYTDKTPEVLLDLFGLYGVELPESIAPDTENENTPVTDTENTPDNTPENTPAG